MKEYSSFAEIDYQLKILALKRDIARERLELKRHKFQNIFEPSHIKEQFRRNFQKTLLTVLITVISRSIGILKK